MTLLAILISLAISRLSESAQSLRQMDWFESWVDWVRERIRADSVWDGPLGVLVVIGVPVLILGWIYALLDSWFGLFGFVFAIILLVASVGPRDVDRQVQQYLDARDYDDAEAEDRHALALGARPNATEARKNLSVIEAILVGTHEQLLAVVFWFVVLGPVGAVLYRLAAILRTIVGREPQEWAGFYQAAEVLQAVLDWIPARLTALGYAITGSFVDALHRWRERSVEWRVDWISGNEGVLLAGGTGALQLDPAFIRAEDEMDATLWTDHVKSAHALARRTVVLWLAVIAVLTLAGWAG